MLGIGAFSCALIMAPVLNLLATAYGIGVKSELHPNALAAPQANLMASVARACSVVNCRGPSSASVLWSALPSSPSTAG